ncbi:VOC family protein [Affinibrenneria salicis]|uniref:VOC family protein n=1 Tax=Affinibrenneria salicis TaxID=2590031 RepID=A0A5J5G7Q6_9GAMM|nr:VOC family protein [Affinibrenneria salicis]KAA9002446.1 VOC family protein [Affinibrenneria salicis]KAA9003266.1 VOC family protein [Affinibrenneria salicis]
MANLLWDHAVHYVNNPDEAITAFTGHQLLAVRGGVHPDWGTHNALSYFGLTYIEFLSIYDADKLAEVQDSFLLSRDALKLLPAHQVLNRVALRSADIDATHATLARQGLSLSPILDGKRHDAQGNLIEWRIFTIDGSYQGVAYPFIIQWGNPDEERLKLLRQRGLDRPHPAGAVTMAAALFDVEQPQAVAAHWQQLFGLARDPQDPARLLIGEEGQRFIFRHGSLNRLSAIQLRTDHPELAGSSLRIGDGEYQFV